MEEQYVLCQLIHSSSSNKEDRDDLKQMLQLTSEQMQQLASQAIGWNEEYAALQTVKAALTDLKNQSWLWNEGCNSIKSQFLNILHKNQVSKFLLWCDHNTEAIDELDFVHAPEAVPTGPVFSFGADASEGVILERQ